MHPTGKAIMVAKDTHKDLKAYQKFTLKKGFKKPEFIPIYVDDNITTFRGGSEGGDKDPLIDLTNISI